MEYGFLSTIPILTLIIGVVITKKMTEMLLLSTLVGAVIIFRGGFFSGYISLLYGTISAESYQFLFLILLGFGPFITLFEKSGAMMGFSKIMSKLARTKKLALFSTWLLGIIIFIDDYLNALTVSASMKHITDRLGIPREHLAYTVNSMGACVCVLIPFTSWAAFAIGCMGNFNMGFYDYIKTIPYMFYPWIAIVISLLLGIGLFPKIGPMKKAYVRVENGGTTTLPVVEDGPKPIINIESAEDVAPGNPINFILPVIVLVAAMIFFNNDLIHGLIAGLITQAILYIGQKIMKPVAFVNGFMEGITNMANLIFVILIGFTLAGINEQLGFSEYMIDVFTRNIHPAFLPAITFILSALVAFASGSFWALVVIAAPVFIPLAQNLGMNPLILVAGIMSGIALGSQACFYSDAVFMTAAGTGVSNVPQVKAALPYVGIGTAIAIIGFLIVGFAAV